MAFKNLPVKEHRAGRYQTPETMYEEYLSTLNVDVTFTISRQKYKVMKLPDYADSRTNIRKQ